MAEHFKVTNETPGYVYAFRDRELDLVKIGFTELPISKRLGQIKSACHVGKPMDIVAGAGLKAVLGYKRLEKLIQTYLQPHWGPSDVGAARRKTPYTESISKLAMTWPRTFSMSGEASFHRIPTVMDLCGLCTLFARNGWSE